MPISAIAGPFVAPGDTALRHDIQVLADNGVIKGPVSTWPLAWGPILADIDTADLGSLPSYVADSLVRVRYRGKLETQTERLGYSARVGIANDSDRIRSFEDTPRGDVDISLGLEWLGDVVSIELNGQLVDSGSDDEDLRLDDSAIGVILGNWSFMANTQQKWWGPGWDGSLILSNNARPLPALTLDRVFPDRFKSKWLSWIGPWDLAVTYGLFDDERTIDNARFFGMRFSMRPIETLEIGFSRTAQWCGDGRPCGFDTFVDLFVGRDNLGDDGIGVDNEPGNQLAGIDARWSPGFLPGPVALYGQFIGEDEAGGFPSRWIGQLGGEWSGDIAKRWSSRLFLEGAFTSCQFYASTERFNCAYNHGIYLTGYRYRGRAVGHGVDNDARLISAGAVLVDVQGIQWRALARYGRLNRGGVPDDRHSLTPTPQDIWSIELAHSREFDFGTVGIGAAYERIDDDASGTAENDFRLYLQWRNLF